MGTKRSGFSRRGCLIAVGCVIVLLACMAWLGSQEWCVWDNAEREDSIQSYEQYLARFPEGEHAAVAERRLQQLKKRRADIWSQMPEWAHYGKANRQDDIGALATFLAEFPNTQFAPAVGYRMAELKKGRTFPRPRDEGLKQQIADDIAPLIANLKTDASLRDKFRNQEAPIRGKTIRLGCTGDQGASLYMWGSDTLPLDGQYGEKSDAVEVTVFADIIKTTTKLGEYEHSKKAAYSVSLTVAMIYWPSNEVVCVCTFTGGPPPFRTHTTIAFDAYGDPKDAYYNWVKDLPIIKICYVCGNVEKPGRYEVQEGTVYDLVTRSGRIPPTDSDASITLLREGEIYHLSPEVGDSIRKRWLETPHDGDAIYVEQSN